MALCLTLRQTFRLKLNKNALKRGIALAITLLIGVFMKKIILSILTISSIASADLGLGTYQGRTSTWLGSLTAKTCILTVDKKSYTLETKNADGSTIHKDVVNMAAGKIKIQNSADGNISTLNYDEIGPSFRLLATIKINQAQSALNWMTTRHMMGGAKVNKVQCVGMKKLN